MNGKRTHGLARWLIILILAGGGTLYAAPAAAPPTTPPPGRSAVDMVDEVSSLVDGAIDEIEAAKKDAADVRARNEALLAANAAATTKVQGLEATLDANADRIQQLGDRYSKVLILAQKMKKDMEFSATMNYILGGTAVVAVLVAVGEALALGGRR